MTSFERIVCGIHRASNALKGIQNCCNPECFNHAEYGVFSRDGHDTYSCGVHLVDMLTVGEDADPGEAVSWTVVPIEFCE